MMFYRADANGLWSLALISVAVCLLAAGWPLVQAGRNREHSNSADDDGDSEAAGEPNSGAREEPSSKMGDLLNEKQMRDLLGGFMGNFMGGAFAGATNGAKGGAKSAKSGRLGDSGADDSDKKADKRAGASRGGNELAEWSKLMFNPAELVKAICAHFKLDYDKTCEAVGKPLIFGVEAFLTPLVVTVKIVEKMFVPDSCKLLFVCKMGAHLEFVRGKVLKLSTKFLEGSKYLKAFGDGVAGRSCEEAFSGCASGETPKLQKQYEEMRRALGAPKSIGASEPQTEAASEPTPSQVEPSAQKATKAAVDRVVASK